MESTATTESQADTSTQSQADETQAEQVNTEAETISLEEARKLRSEAKNLRSRLKDSETRLSAIDAEKLTETEKLQKRVDELSESSTKREGALKTMLLSSAIAELKDATGLRSTKSIAKLIDTDVLEFDLDGLSVKGVADELKRLKKEDPDLFVMGGTDGGAGGSARAGSGFDMNTAIKRAAGRG